MIAASTKMAAIESIKSGVTYIVDHHSSPNSAKDCLKTISEELEKFNIRNGEWNKQNESSYKSYNCVRTSMDYLCN